METFIIVVAILLGILGMVGSVAPALPGPPLSWLGLLFTLGAAGRMQPATGYH